MSRLTATEVREGFAETLNRVVYKSERVVIHRRGKNLAALVPLEDLELLRALEDRLDLETAREALREDPKGTAWAKVKKRLGL